MLKNIFYLTLFMIVALLALALLPVRVVSAVPTAVIFTVNSTLDQPDDLTIPGTCHTAANTCTLRAGVMQANRTSGLGATIIVPAGIYTLTLSAAGLDGEENGDLNLTMPGSGNPKITITGAGAGSTIIDANQLDRVIRIDQGRTANIDGVTIRNGYRQGPTSFGGGIFNEGTLTIADCVIDGNYAEYNGGGINSSGMLNVVGCTLRSNVSDVGGGLYVAGPSTVRDSTFYRNGAGDGGGIFNVNVLYVINSTISQNYANTHGGGIYTYRGTIALYNVSVIDNDADHDRDENGGIGGGVYSQAGSGNRFIVVNTLIAGNTILNAPIYNDCNGMLEVYGFNLLYDETGCTYSGNGSASRGFITLDTIGPLQDNGGPTWTHALLPGSAAIDTTIDSLGCVDETGALLTTDQRGAVRPVGARCDVGAFEYRPLFYIYLPLILR